MSWQFFKPVFAYKDSLVSQMKKTASGSWLTNSLLRTDKRQTQVNVEQSDDGPLIAHGPDNPKCDFWKNLTDKFTRQGFERYHCFQICQSKIKMPSRSARKRKGILPFALVAFHCMLVSRSLGCFRCVQVRVRRRLTTTMQKLSRMARGMMKNSSCKNRLQEQRKRTRIPTSHLTRSRPTLRRSHPTLRRSPPIRRHHPPRVRHSRCLRP